MGTSYFLVDEAGKNVLWVGKWRELLVGDWSAVTAEDINNARVDGCILADLALAWIQEVAGGRTISFATDNESYPWQDDQWEDMPGWTIYDVASSPLWVVRCRTWVEGDRFNETLRQTMDDLKRPAQEERPDQRTVMAAPGYPPSAPVQPWALGEPKEPSNG